MSAAGTSGAVVYNFPPQIIERQRYINFLRQYEPYRPLLAWFISVFTGRLLGVWNVKDDKLTWSSFDLVGEDFIFYGRFNYPNPTRDLWNNMKGSPAFGVMPAMKEYLGLTRHEDAKPI